MTRMQLGQSRQILLSVIVDYDEMTLHRSPNAMMDYTLSIGTYEYDLFLAQLTLSRARRMLELIEEAADAGTAPDMSHIEDMIDGEFSDTADVASEQRDRVNQALERNLNVHRADDDELNDLRLLYTPLLERVHPSLYLAHSDARERTYQEARDAFRDSDAAKLKDLLDHCGDTEDDLSGIDDIKQLDMAIAACDAQARELRLKLAQIRSSFPVTAIPTLRNRAACEAQAESLRRQTAALEEQGRQVELEIEAALNRSADAGA